MLRGRQRTETVDERIEQAAVRDRYTELINFVNLKAYDNACQLGRKDAFYAEHIEPTLKTIILTDLYGERWGNFLVDLGEGDRKEKIRGIARSMAGPIEMLRGRKVEPAEGLDANKMIVRPGTWEIYNLDTVKEGVDTVIVDFGWPFSTRAPPAPTTSRPYAYVAKKVELEKPASEDEILNSKLENLLGIKMLDKHLQLLFNSRTVVTAREERYTLIIKKGEEQKEEPKEPYASELP